MTEFQALRHGAQQTRETRFTMSKSVERPWAPERRHECLQHESWQAVVLCRQSCQARTAPLVSAAACVSMTPLYHFEMSQESASSAAMRAMLVHSIHCCDLDGNSVTT